MSKNSLRFPVLVMVIKLAWSMLSGYYKLISESMLVCFFSQYAQETQHEKILRGLSLGIALVSCFFVVLYSIDCQ